MKSVFGSVFFGFAVVSVLGASTLSASSFSVKNVVIELGSHALEGDLSASDFAKAGVHCAAVAGAVPATIAGASALGVTASTGTAISALSGAAAVSATSAAIGTPVVSALGAIGVTVAAPATVGGIIIIGVATGMAYGFNTLFFDED